MSIDIQKLKALAEAATPGPWEAVDYGDHSGMESEWYVDTSFKKADITADEEGVFPNHWDGIRAEKDMSFIAAANPVSVLELIAEIERLNAGLAELAELKAYMTMPLRDRCAERKKLKSENDSLRQQLAVPSDVLADCEALRLENEALRNALTECSDSLHAEMLQKFGGQLPDDMHPVTRREYDRDMAETACYRVMLSKEASHD